MTPFTSGEISGQVRPILAAIRTVPIPVHPGQEPREGRAIVPFVTISRQAGAGGHSLAERLVQRLNIADPAERPWTCWDRELAEKVAADQHVSKALVEALENTSHTWMQDFLSGLSGGGQTLEDSLYRGVVTTIRALAQAGRVVIVGAGGVFVTRNMPGGIHVRLVAPLAHRIEHMRNLLQVSREQAAAHVRQLDRNREAFYKRYWPQESVSPETFTVTFNTALMDDDKMTGAILPLVPAISAQT